MAHDQVRSLRTQGWAWFDYAVLDEYGPLIKAEGIAVYMVLARHADNNTQQSFPAVATIAEKINMSERQVRRILKRLEDAGLIAIEPQHDAAGRQLSNLYTLQPVSKVSYRGDTQSPSGVTTSPGGGDRESHKQDSVNKTHRNKTQRESAPAPVDIAPIAIADEAPRDMQSTGRAIKPTPIRKHALPNPYPLTEEMRVWVQMEEPGVGDGIDREHKKFCATYWANGEVRANWRPMWELWMHRVEEFTPKQQKGSSNGTHYQTADERKADTYAQWANIIRAGQADDDPDGERRQGLRLIG